MNNMTKLAIGFVLGYVGYIAWKKMSATKTLVVSDNTKQVVGAYPGQWSKFAYYLSTDV